MNATGPLGTPEAKALRATVSDEHAARIVAMAREMDDAERGGESGCTCESGDKRGCYVHDYTTPDRPAPLAEPDTDDAQPATQRCWKELGRSDTQPHLVAVCAKPEGHEGECSNVLPKPGGSR